jgi:hypothetical protein
LKLSAEELKKLNEALSRIKIAGAFSSGFTYSVGSNFLYAGLFIIDHILIPNVS